MMARLALLEPGCNLREHRCRLQDSVRVRELARQDELRAPLLTEAAQLLSPLDGTNILLQQRP
jgi:hypothetical protein